MKMKVTAALAVLFAAALAFAATDAAKVAEEYLDAWQFKDYEEMYPMLVKEEKEGLGEKEFFEKMGKATFVPVKAEIGSTKVDGETAKVRVTLEDTQGLVRKETLRLRSEEGEWKVVPLYLDVPAIARAAAPAAAAEIAPAEKAAPNIPQLSLDEILQKLEKRGDEVTDLVARIKYEAPVMGMSVAMAGEMMYKRPNKFRLDFTTPAEMSIISDGKTIWVAAPGAKVGYATDVGDMQDQENVILGLGESAKRMREEYEVSYIGTDLVDERPAYRLKLKSKRESAPMAAVELWVDAKLWIPIKNVGESAEGLKVAMTLDNIQLNVGLEDGLFTYEVPPDMNMQDLDLGLLGE